MGLSPLIFYAFPTELSARLEASESLSEELQNKTADIERDVEDLKTAYQGKTVTLGMSR